MDKRDKRVVAAAVAAAIIIAIAILGAGWYFAIRDDDGSQAVGPTPSAPASATADADSGRTAQPQSAGTAPPSTPAGTDVVDTATPSPGQADTTGRSDSTQVTDLPDATGPPAQITESGVSQPAAGLATSNLLASPDAATTPPVLPAFSTPARPGAPSGNTLVDPGASPPAADLPTGNLLASPETTASTPTLPAVSTPARPAAPSGDTVIDPGASRPMAGSATANLAAAPEIAAASPAQSAGSTPAGSTTPASPASIPAADPGQTSPTTTPTAQTATSAPAAVANSAEPAGNAVATPPAGRSVLSDELVAALPSIRPPSFDVVRVNELGDAVIAGRAEPRSVVIIYDGDREIGRVAADSRGEWVFVSDRPLIPGQHEIGLLSRSGPQSRLSDQVVVLIAPEPRQDIAGQPTGGDIDREKPLALLVPRDEIGATTVLQSPPAVVTERAPDDPASRPGRPAIAATTTTAPADPAAPSRIAAPSVPTTGGAAPVSIDVVDYDEAGQLIVSGRSTPQSDVRLYLDNEYVGTARAGADGTFRVQPTEPVEPGVYALRIDEVSPVGSVTARAETPFQRANEVAAIPGYSSIVVQPGNSLWRLARRVYGEGIQYTVIYQANTGQIRNPDLIYPGQIFSVPEMPTDVPAGDPS